MKVRIFLTGGTFDKEYNELNGELFFKDTHLPEMLKLGRNLVDVEMRTLMMIDSLHMTDADRKTVAENCAEVDEKNIVITHGTDTMVDTAEVVAEKVKDKTVVLTGAMVPWKFCSSDGLFNLGSAIAFAQSMPAGVYIAMNGHIFQWDKVKKNKKLGIFEDVK